jgi:multiple sugar transport system permease protein
MAKRKKYDHSAFLFIAPILIGISIFYLYAFVRNIYLSFNDVGVFGERTFVGLENFRKLMEDPIFKRALLNTAFYAGVGVPLIVMLSVCIAWLLNQKIRGQSFYRTAIFIPAITLPAAIALLWRWLFNSQYGLINYFLAWFGVEPIAWLGDPDTVRWSILIVLVWAAISYMVIILLAGLQRISSTYYEAAQIDGANTWQIFFKITIPLLTPTIFFVTIVSMIGMLQVFDFIFLMIRVDTASYRYAVSLVTYFFETSFTLNQRGYGAAVSVISLIIIFAITAIQFRLQKRWVNYD